MPKRLNSGRQEKVEPKRMQYAKDKITELGFEITFESACELNFVFKSEKVKFFPYSGWHSGKTIKDGRGINELLKQIKP